MSLSAHFFAHQGTAFAKRLGESPTQIIAQVQSWAKGKRFGPKKLESGMKYVTDVCMSEPLKHARAGHFNALCWIGEAIMEPIALPEFCELGSIGIIKDIGIVPGLLKTKAPYALPRHRDAWGNTVYVAGYLPWTKISEFRFVVSGAGGDDEDPEPEELSREVDRLLENVSRAARGVTSSADSDRLQWEQTAFARQQFNDVLETLVEDKLDLLAVIVE